MRSGRLFVGPIEQNATLVHLSCNTLSCNSRMIEQARDFESPAALANHLLAVDLDPEAYGQYHAWRKRPLRELNPRLAHRLLFFQTSAKIPSRPIFEIPHTFSRVSSGPFQGPPGASSAFIRDPLGLGVLFGMVEWYNMC